MMTQWDDIVGYTCIYCGHWATHWYGDVPICCDCHIGEKGADEYMAAKAIVVNTAFQKGLSFPHATGDSVYHKDYILGMDFFQMFKDITDYSPVERGNKT